MRNRITAALTALAATVLLFSSCSKNEDTKSGTSKFSVYLTDAPSPYDKVNVDIQDVMVNTTTDTAKGWVSLHMIKPGVYNLLDFANGIDTLLASYDIPAGKISQVRLVLGSNNSVVIGANTYPLETPSAQQSGLKLNVNADLVAGVEYRLWLDFDANRSVVTTGNGKYILKPVIRTYTEATSGSIAGIVLPPLSSKGVFILQNTDTVAAAIPDATGAFLVAGLNAGAYNVAVAGNGILKDTTLLNVNVTVGKVTTVGTVTLH